MLLGTLTTGSGTGTDHTLHVGLDVPPASSPAVRVAQSFSQNGGTTFAFTIPAAVVVGDQMFFQCATGYSSGTSVVPPAPTGWSLVTTGAASGAASVGLYQRVAQAGDAGSTVTVNVSDFKGYVITFVALSDHGSISASGQLAGNTAPTLAGLTKNTKVLTFYDTNYQVGNTPPSVSGMTAVTTGAEASDVTASVYQQVIATDGPSTPLTTNGGGAVFYTISVAIAPAAGASAVDGDSFLDKAHRQFYGEMSGGAWPASVGLRHNDPVAKTAAYTAVDGDVVLASAATAAFNVTLPAATIGAKIVVKKTDASANGVTVLPTAGTIDGGANYLLSIQNATAVFISDGTNWFTHIDTMRAPRPASTLNGLPVKWNNTTGVFEDATALINKLYTGSGAPPPSIPQPRTAAASVANATSINVTVPATAQVGDICLIGVTSRNTTGYACTTAGWTELAHPAGLTFSARLYWKKLVAGEPGSNVNFTIGSISGNPVQIVAVYSDTDGNGPVASSNASGSTFPVLTGLPINCRVVYFAFGDAPGGAPGNPSISGLSAEAVGFGGASNGEEGVVTSESLAAGGSSPAHTASFVNDATASQQAVFTLAFAHSPAATAQNGDTFLDKANRRFYGQMSAGAWGAATPLRHNDPVAKTAAYTAVDGDIVLANATTAAFTVTLPVPVAGAKVVVKKTDASANAVTVGQHATETIDGATTQAIAAQWGKLTVVSDGTNWFTI